MIDRLRATLAGRRERWESLCHLCGGCCYRKDWRGNRVIINWKAPCRFLDTTDGRCTVYERRFRECSDCRPMTIFHALFTGWLPDSCGYVQAYRGRISRRRV